MVDSDDRLHYRKVRVARIDGEQVQIEKGLKTGDRVVVSPLKTVVDGMTIRSVPQMEETQG